MNQEKALIFLINKFKEESWEYKDLKVGNDIEEQRVILRSLMNIRMPKPISDDVLKVQDEYLRERIKENGIVTLKDIPTVKDSLNSNNKYNSIFSIWNGDITRLSVDAIVNAANSEMLGCFRPMHTCIDNCIHTFAGIQLRNECYEKMKKLKKEKGENYEQPTSLPMITEGYNLPAKKVIHVVGPIVEYKINKELIKELSDCYINVLDMCKDNNIRSVAFCCISTGVFNFPNKEASEIAVKSVSEWLEKNNYLFERIIFDVFTEIDYKLYSDLFINKEK